MRSSRIYLLLSGMVSVTCLLTGAWPAWGADSVPSAARIGVVNVDRVFKEYKATQTKEKELEKISTGKVEEREKIVSDIRNLRDELALLNEENRAKQRQTIEGKLRQLAAFDQQTKEALRDQKEQAVDGLLKEIEQVVTSFAKERGYDLILSNRAVLYGVETVDLTNEVISILNQKYAKATPGGER